MVEVKPTISLIWIGHVDHGKSTTLGHLLSMIGAIDSRTMDKLKEEAIEYQMESWQWAYVLDTLPEEKQMVKQLIKDIQSPWGQLIEKIPFIPISGLAGENLSSPSDKMSWYKGNTLLDALNSLEGVKFESNKEMRFIGYDIVERHGFGTFLMGKVLSSSINTNDKVTILPLGIKSEVKELWDQDKKLDSLKPGQHGSVLLRNLPKDILDEGIVLAPGDSSYEFVTKIQTRLLILEGTFVPGTSVVFHCGASYTTAQINQISKILNKNPKHKKLPREFEGKITIAFEGELVEAEIVVNSPLVVQKFSDYPELGRIILRHSGQTIAVGIIHQLLADQDD
jgi:elongation factor 1-alpha